MVSSNSLKKSFMGGTDTPVVSIFFLITQCAIITKTHTHKKKQKQKKLKMDLNTFLFSEPKLPALIRNTL